MKAAPRRWALLGLVVALTAPLGNAAQADHVRVVADVTVSPAAKVEQGYMLAVKLRTSDGRPLNEATVRFYQSVELFGDREMLIATARTDGQGNGSTTYLPARTGLQEIVMRFAGRDHVAPFEVRRAFDAAVAAAPYRAATPPLASFSAAVPYGVGVVVLSVWALIAFAFFGTALGIRRGARDHQQETRRRHIA